MISIEQVTLTYFGIGALLGIIGQSIYLFKIAPVLYSHGSRLFNLLTTFAGHEIPKYEEICIRENKSLIWYDIYKTIGKTITVWVLIFIISLIVFVFISSFIAIAKMMNQPVI